MQYPRIVILVQTTVQGVFSVSRAIAAVGGAALVGNEGLYQKGVYVFCSAVALVWAL